MAAGPKTSTVSPQVGCYHLNPLLPFSKAERLKAEGFVDWKDAKCCISQWFFNQHINCPQQDSTLGSSKLQSDHCNLQCSLIHAVSPIKSNKIAELHTHKKLKHSNWNFNNIKYRLPLTRNSHESFHTHREHTF